jgi:hypothetical protein
LSVNISIVPAVFIAEFHAMLAMNMNRVGDDQVHHAVDRERRLPRERLVDAPRAAVGVDEQILWPGRKAERRAGQGLIGLDLAVPAGGLGQRRDVLGERRLVAEAAGGVDAAEQGLQQVDRETGVEAVGMGRDAAHRVHADRSSDHLVVAAPGPIGPRQIEDDLLGEGGVGELGGDAPDRRRRDAACRGRNVGAVLGVEITFGEELEHGHALAPIGQFVGSLQRRRRIGRERAPACLPATVPA